jgi:hypothetical protein
MRAVRITKARKRIREQLPVTEARQRLEQARKAEIATRKFRNHMRDTLFAEPPTWRSAER